MSERFPGVLWCSHVKLIYLGRDGHMKTSVEVDEKLLGRVKRLLGTETIRDTIRKSFVPLIHMDGDFVAIARHSRLKAMNWVRG